MRVEGFWKISATLRPASAREEQRRALQLERAVEQRVELGGGQLGAGEEVARGIGAASLGARGASAATRT